jgi:hypothetical protein
VTRGVVGDSLLPLLSGNTVGLTGVSGSNAGADFVSEEEELKNWRPENSRSLTRTPAISFTYNIIAHDYTDIRNCIYMEFRCKTY